MPAHPAIAALTLLASCLSPLAAGWAAPAAAQLQLPKGSGAEAPPAGLEERLPRAGQAEPPAGETRGREPQHLDRAQAAARARAQHGGRVLSVRWTGGSYRVKLLREGEIRIVRVEDAPGGSADR